MKKIFLVLLSMATLALAACGGGGSSSDSSVLDGDRFFGAQTVTVLGVSSNSEFVMSIEENIRVTIIDDDFTASGALISNRFQVNVPPFTFSEDGLTCTFDVSYNGTLETETRVTGTISGTAVCDGVPVQISGTFAANRG